MTTQKFNRDGWNGHQYFYHTNDPDAVLSYSHYSDPHFDEPNGAIIYGEDVAGLTWSYADRLYRWHPELAKSTNNAMHEKYDGKRCARRTEEWLSIVLDKRVKLVCIRSGTQQFNGYPWYAYGYVVEE